MTKRKFLNIINKQRIPIVIIILVIYLGLSSEKFVSYNNMVNILMQISINGLIAIGMTILLLQGEIDLSVGYNMTLVGTVIILLQGYGLGLAVVCGMLTGILVGVINGLIVTKLKLDSLPATLGMMIALKGMILWLTKTETIRGTVESFLFLGNETFYSIPYPVMILIIILLIFILIIRRTVFGRNIYAVGGNKIASRFFGINVDRTRFISFIIAGFLVSISGVILTSRLNIASPNLGIYTHLFALTATLLGGNSLFGGKGGLVGTFQGILLLGIISNGLRFTKVPVTFHLLINGLLLILIVSIDGYYVKRAKFR